MKPFPLIWCCLALAAATPQTFAQKNEPPADSLKSQNQPSQKPIQDSLDRIQELSEKVVSISDAQKQARPGAFNPAIGVVGELVTSYSRKGMAETGSDRPGGIDFNARSVELNVAASIDPFAKGYAVINASADPVTGEASLGVEEAALQTTGLPGNLELKAGRFFGEFGRLAYIHDHELPFVNRPLVLDQYIGGESRSDGLQINWLLPLPHYVSLTAGAGDQFGGDAPPSNPGDFRGFNELSYWGRLSTYFDVTSNWQAELGVSGLINPSTEDRGGALLQPNGDTLTENQRRLAGVDFSLRWVPLRNNQFESLTWGTEVLVSGNRFVADTIGGDAGFNRTVTSYGLYSYLTWKFTREWSVGFLFDWMENYQNAKEESTDFSPCITWAMSHWNQLRLQYTHTTNSAETGLTDNDAVYMQWAWIIGAHSHGWQQR